MRIGICGVGFVGNAINNFFINKEDYQIILYDKYKDYNTIEELLDTEILFVCLPTLYDDQSKSYDMSSIDETLLILNNFLYNGIILIKSTVLPVYCYDKSLLYPNLNIIHNPEFLSARTAREDFASQSHIILGYTNNTEYKVDIIKNFYSKLFPQAKISITNSNISSLVKIACNSFYSTKIQFFTEIFLLCENLNISYNEVKDLMLLNNWINPMHTMIPGNDSNISFGGACLPKDISALNEFMIKKDIPNKVINSTIVERNEMRKD